MDLVTLLAVEVLASLAYFLLRRGRPEELARSILMLLLPLAIVAYMHLPSPQGVEAAYEQLERAYYTWRAIYIASSNALVALAIQADALNTAMILSSFGITAVLRTMISTWTMAKLNPLLDAAMTANAVSQAFMMISKLFADVVWYAQYAWPMLLLGYALVVPRRVRAFGALLIIFALVLLAVAKLGGQFAGAAMTAAEKHKPVLKAVERVLNSTPIEPNAVYHVDSPVPTLLLTPVKASWNWVGMLENAIHDAARYELKGCNFTAPQSIAAGVVDFFTTYGEYAENAWTDIVGHVWHIYRYRVPLDVAQEALNRAWWFGSYQPCGLPRIYYDRSLGVGAAIINSTWKWALRPWRSLNLAREDWGIAAPQPLVNRSWIAAFAPAAAVLPLGNLAIEYPEDRGVMIINWLDYNAALTATPIRPLPTVLNETLSSRVNSTYAQELQSYYFNAAAPFGAWRAYEIALPPPPWWLLTPAENAVYDWDMIYGWAWHASGKPTGVMGSFGWLYSPSAASYPDRVIWHGQNGQPVLTLALKASHGRPNVVNFTVRPRNATLYYYNVTIDLRHWRETCKWWACVEWINGTCARWEQRSTSRPIDENYRLDPREITLTYDYNLTLYRAPWRTSWTARPDLTEPFNYTLKFEIPAINYSVVKYNVTGSWDNGPPPSNATCSVNYVGTTAVVIKAVRPIVDYTAIAAWAWLNKTRLTFNAPPAPQPPAEFNGSLVWPRPLLSTACKYGVLNLGIPSVLQRLIQLAAFANSTVYSLDYNLSRIYGLEAEMWKGRLPNIALSPSSLNFLNPELPRVTVFQLLPAFNATPLMPPLGYSLYEPYAVCVVIWLLPRGYEARGLIRLQPASPWSYNMPIAYTPEMERLVNATLAFALSGG